MAVEKHLLQNWQKRVLLLRFPAGLGWPLSFLGLLGQVQQLDAFLAEVPRGPVVPGSQRQLGVRICKEQLAHVSIGVGG